MRPLPGGSVSVSIESPAVLIIHSRYSVSIELNKTKISIEYLLCIRRHEKSSGSVQVYYVQLFVTPRTVACQSPLSVGFSRQEYWGG